MRPLCPVVLSVLLAASASAQPALDVVGVWEMVDAEGVPYEDALVFARLTFTADALRTTSVFLDPDDGELIGQVEEARYVVSDGQLVVRDGAGTTVLAVEREGDRLSVLDLETGVLLRLAAADPAAGSDPALVGAWRAERDGRVAVLRFTPGGAVAVQEGGEAPDDETYTVAGPYLLIGDEPVRYAVEDGGRRLVLRSDSGTTEYSPFDG